MTRDAHLSQFPLLFKAEMLLTFCRTKSILLCKNKNLFEVIRVSAQSLAVWLFNAILSTDRIVRCGVVDPISYFHASRIVFWNQA